MSRVYILVSPDPVVPPAMIQLLRAIDALGQCSDPLTLSLRSAALVGTVRRRLLATKGRNVHSDLRLAAALSEYERRWNSSAVIALKFDSFERDSRNLMAMLDQRVPDRQLVRSTGKAPNLNRGYRAPQPLLQTVRG